MTIDRLRAHWGFTRMPFSKDLAPSMLHTHRSHAEAVARITWCVDERVIGVVTGEVGAGKTVAVRAALAGLDASRNTVIYLGNPSVGARGLYSTIVSTLGGTPIPPGLAHPPGRRGARHRGARTGTPGGPGPRRGAPPRCRAARRPAAVDERRDGQPLAVRLPPRRPADAAPADPPRCLRRARPARGAPLRDDRHGRPETADYVVHHLRLAGRSDTLFSDDALALVHQVSRGLPRAVNNLAVQSLVAAFAENKAIVDESSARAAVTEVTAE